MRGLQWTRVIERTFYTDTEVEREEWITAIEKVAEAIQDGGFASQHFDSFSELTRNKTLTSEDSNDSIGRSSSHFMDMDLSNKFEAQGVSYGRSSGKKRVVCYLFIQCSCVLCKSTV